MVTIRFEFVLHAHRVERFHEAREQEGGSQQPLREGGHHAQDDVQRFVLCHGSYFVIRGSLRVSKHSMHVVRSRNTRLALWHRVRVVSTGVLVKPVLLAQVSSLRLPAPI